MYIELWQMLEKSKDQLAFVQSEYLSAASKYLQLKDSILPFVQCWEWSSSLPRYELDPLYFLDDSARRGKATNKEPKSIAHKKQYGFDVNGRVIAERNHVEFSGQFYENFFIYGTSEVSSFLFDYSSSKAPINCKHLRLENGIPTSLHSQAKYGHSSNIYIIEGSKIKYFCSLHTPDERKPFGGCGEIVFREADIIELWDFLAEDERHLSFEGHQSCYNTLLLAPSKAFTGA